MQSSEIAFCIGRYYKHVSQWEDVHMKGWPNVVGEFETVKKLAEGYSISRHGDGEFKLLDGKSHTRLHWIENPKLTEELRHCITKPNAGCLIGIPTMDPKGDKYENWKRHKIRFAKWLNTRTKYYSAFISRPDCGTAWMECYEYAEALRTIWAGKRIAIVCEPDSKLLTEVRNTNMRVDHIVCPSYNAYDEIDRFEREILAIKPEITLLSVGLTATALANRIAGHGFQAVDMGSIGAFFQRWPIT